MFFPETQRAISIQSGQLWEYPTFPDIHVFWKLNMVFSDQANIMKYISMFCSKLYIKFGPWIRAIFVQTIYFALMAFVFLQNLRNNVLRNQYSPLQRSCISLLINGFIDRYQGIPIAIIELFGAIYSIPIKNTEKY